MIRVSVVVPTYRRPDLLSRCLGALARQQVEAHAFEVIVADDACEESVRELVEHTVVSRFAIHYVPVTGHHGPAAARNAGWRMARGEIIAFTDDDCVPDSGWLAAGVRPFSEADVIAVTGQTIVPLPPSPTDYELNTAGLENSEFITANCFCRRVVLESLGGFDERFTTAWREDSDLHFRLLDTGKKIVREKLAVVIHPIRPAAFGASIREQRKAMFDALLFRKHPHRFRQRITPACPWSYYFQTAAAIAVFMAIAFGRLPIAAIAAGIWLALVGRFLLRRLKNTSRSPEHIAEMIVTSLAIPFLSIYWRLRGAWRFGVFFW